MNIGRYRKTRVALGVAALCGALGVQAQTFVPPPAPGEGGGPAANSAPVLDDTTPVTANVAPGASVIVPLPSPDTRGSDAESDALGWTFAGSPGEARTDVDGGSAMINGNSLSFFPASGFTGRASVPLALMETVTADRLSSVASLSVVVSVDGGVPGEGAPAMDVPAQPVSEPGPPEPGVPEGGPPEPEMLELVSSESDVPEAGPPEPEMLEAPPESAVPEAGPPEPEMLEPEPPEPGVPEAGPPEPEVLEPAPPEPGAPEAGPPESEMPEPAPSEPEISAPEPPELEASVPEPAAPTIPEPMEVDVLPGPELEGESDADGIEPGPSTVPDGSPIPSLPTFDDPQAEVPEPDDASASVGVPETVDDTTVDDTGDVLSDMSSGAEMPTAGQEIPATATAAGAETDGNGTPIPVGGLRLVAASDRAIAIAWEAASGAVTTVERDGVEIATVEGSRFVDTDVVAGQRYVYTLGADSARGRVFAEAVTDGLGADVRSPSAPGEVLALRRADGAVVIAWQGGGDDRSVAGYDLYRDGRYFTTVYATAHVDADAPDAVGTLYDVVAFDEARNYSPRSVATFVDGDVPPTSEGAGSVAVTTDSRGRFSFAPVNRSPSVIVLVGEDAATSLWPDAMPRGAVAGGFVTSDADIDVLVLPAFGAGEPSGLALRLRSGDGASSTLVFDPASPGEDG